MRTRHLFAFFAVAVALLLPYAAHAQCSPGTCVSFGVYNPISNTIAGYSTYEYNPDPGCYIPNVTVTSNLSTPGGNVYLGTDTQPVEAGVPVSYTPVAAGTYTITASNYYQIQGGGGGGAGTSSYQVTISTLLQPTGEYSTALGQFGSGPIGQFSGTVFNGILTFAGRTVTESYYGNDGCYFPDSPYPNYSQFFNSSWSVPGPNGIFNTYNSDIIGLQSWPAVNYYANVSSCIIGGTQSMTMNGGSLPYDSHSSGLYIISPSSVYVLRSNACVALVGGCQ